MHKNICILLSTHNGELFLEELVSSLRSQTNQQFDLLCLDDASTDGTLALLEKLNIHYNQNNDNKGIKYNINKLLKIAVNQLQYDYFMFCDQDDIWNTNKIEITLQKMKKIEKESPDLPILLHSDLEVVDKDLRTIEESFWHFANLNPSCNAFHRLLMQNTITGCTVMINRKLAELALPISNDVIMHDWWLGLVASKFGKIAYINEALVRYRQHGKNSIGAVKFNILKKYRESIDFEKHIKQAKVFLTQYRSYLSKNSIRMLEDFTQIESQSYWQKRRILLKHKLLKQGFLRNLGLLLKI